jgi:hemolysin D
VLGGATGETFGDSLRRHWQVLRDSWSIESVAAKRRVGWRDSDFLPAALEIVERPPNPLGRIVLWALIAFIALALVWSIVARVDVVASAPGKVIASGRNKLLQAADGGVVRAIFVRDGQRVRRGQALMTLDPTNAGADRAQAYANLQTAEIEIARSHALLAGLEGRPATFAPPAAAPPLIVSSQRQLIASRLAEYRAKVAGLRSQGDEAAAANAGARAEMGRLQATLPFLSERVDRRQQLVDRGYASRLQQLELQEQRVDHERQITVQAENARRARAAVVGVGQQLAGARAEALHAVLDELTKAESDGRLAREELTKADQRSRLQTLRAPVDGIVQQLAVYSEGAVLKPADPILVVVPDRAELVVEAQVQNRDIGFVRSGQVVTIKLEAFPFTRYGTLSGRLAWVSRDAIQDEKLGPVYQARVTVSPPSRSAAASAIRVAPGLQATAEIRTDERRVIDYLLSPLERRANEAGRER